MHAAWMASDSIYTNNRYRPTVFGQLINPSTTNNHYRPTVLLFLRDADPCLHGNVLSPYLIKHAEYQLWHSLSVL